MGTMKKPDFEAVLGVDRSYGRRVYIETGLYKGDRISIAAECFDVVHGIELDPHFYRVNKARAGALPHVTIHHGDSRDVLPLLIETYKDVPCFFYLDAHFCETSPPIQKSEFPLWTELERIKAKRTRDIIVVDDVHTFGVPRPELRYKPDSTDWEGVTQKSLLDYFGPRAQGSLEVCDSFVIWKKEAP